MCIHARAYMYMSDYECMCMCVCVCVCVCSHIHMYKYFTWLPITEHIHGCRHSAKYFTYIISLHFHKNPKTYFPYITPTF